jgi:hypothetical protein
MYRPMRVEKTLEMGRWVVNLGFECRIELKLLTLPSDRSRVPLLWS